MLMIGARTFGDRPAKARFPQNQVPSLAALLAVSREEMGEHCFKKDGRADNMPYIDQMLRSRTSPPIGKTDGISAHEIILGKEVRLSRC